MSETSPQDYLDNQEAAKYLRISVTALYNLRRNKGLPFIKLGKKVLYSREVLNTFVQKQTQAYQ
jgi:excisionase family DNA binding protein